MRKLLITTCCILAGCFLLTGIILPTMKNQKTMAQTTSTIESSSTQSTSMDTTSSQATGQYIVKEYNGNIAVFYNGMETPVQTTDVSVNTLPYPDQKDLQIGIAVNSKEELTRLLEDLCS